MDNNQIEQKVRNFLLDEMMKDEVKNISNDDILMLDSIEQVEMRVFLEEEFSIVLDNQTEPFTTITQIIQIIHNN